MYIYMSSYYELHKAHLKIYQKAYNTIHKIKIKEYQRNYYFRVLKQKRDNIKKLKSDTSSPLLLAVSSFYDVSDEVIIESPKRKTPSKFIIIFN